MDCVETQRLITAFINDKIEEDVLPKFFDHIESCGQCREEAEVHYIMTIGLLLLDEDTTYAYNLHNEFEKHLRKAKEKIWKREKRLIKKKVTFIVIILLFILLVSTGVETIVSVEEEKITQQEIEEKGR